MGYKDKKYSRDLKQQIQTKLEDMLHAGEGTSKREAIQNGTDKDKIFSYNTYKTYKKHNLYFANYVKENHPECTTLKKAEKYVSEWLDVRTNQVDKNGKHLSAWTIQTEAKAINKLFGISPEDENYYTPPQRRREDIYRSRGETVRDKHFSEKNNAEFVNFCRGTGCRRNIMEKLEGRDLYTKDQLIKEIEELKVKDSRTPAEEKQFTAMRDALKYFPEQDVFIHHRTDKGGRDRYAPIIGPDKDRIVERMRDTAPNEKVWMHVPKNADIHGYRGDYATRIYKSVARPIDQIPYDKVNKGTGRKYQSGVYTCRKDEKGKKLDREAMLLASKALGHNRIEIVANNYIRGL